MKVNFRTKRNALVKIAESNMQRSHVEQENSDAYQKSHESRVRKTADNLFNKKNCELLDLDPQILLNMMNIAYNLQPRDRKAIIPFEMKENDFSLEKESWKLDEWIGEMYSAVVSASFQLFIKNELSYQEVKVYCSENLLLNILLFVQKINETEIIEVMKHINLKLQDNLGYLLTKYPQAKEIKPNKKLRSVINSINNLQNDENDMVLVSQIKFTHNQSGDYTSEIMEFINFLISLPTQKCLYKGKSSTYFQAFNEIMQKIFQSIQYPQQSYKESEFCKYIIENWNISESKRQINERQALFDDLMKGEDESSDSDSFISEGSQMRPRQTAKTHKSKKSLKKQKRLSRASRRSRISDIQIGNNLLRFDEKQIKLFQQKVKNYTSYKIGVKINTNTELFKPHEIDQGTFKIKSTAILRVLSKWTEELQQKILEAKEKILKRSFRFKSKKGDFIKLNASQKNNLYQGAERQVPKIKQLMKYITDECIEIEANLSKKIEKSKELNHIPKHQFMVGSFCSKLQSAASNYLVNYLSKIIDVLLAIPENSFQGNLDGTTMDIKSKNVNLITFKIGDLMRCKCSSHEDEILRIFNLIKKISENECNLIKIVRIKDRLELGTRDILININFMNKILCEIQLAVTDQMDLKQQKYDAFNHYLYELKRSTLGPIMESACIWTHFDQRSKNFKNIIKNPVQAPNSNINFRKHICNKQHMENHKYSFVCSLCGTFYSSSIGIISSKKCLCCRKYYECRNCIENRMTSDELKEIFKFKEGTMKYFQMDFQRWKPTAAGVFPDFCILIPKNHKQIIYYFTQKIILRGVCYLLHITQNQSTKNLNINTIAQFKLDDFTDLNRLNQKFFVYEWTERRLINRTLTADLHIQILQRQEEKKLELEKKIMEEKLKIKQKVKDQRKKMWPFSRAVEEQTESSEEDEEQERECRKREKKKKTKKPSANEEGQQEQNQGKKWNFSLNKNAGERSSFHPKSGHSFSSDGSMRKAQRKRRVKEADSQQFIEIFCKRSEHNDTRISEKYNKGTTYYLILGFFLKEGKLKIHIKNKLNEKAVQEMYENKTEVIFLQEQKIKEQLQLAPHDSHKFSTSLRNITEIYIDQNKIKDIYFIKDFLKLQIFHANHNFISDISPLANLKNLTEIMLSNNSIEQITGLNNKPKLASLILCDNKIAKIQNLNHISTLKKISLCDNHIETIENLEKLPNLEELDLSLNFIQRIQGTEDLVKLKDFSLAGNQIKKIENIQNQTKLQKLNLNYNQIERIENLQNCTQLEVLELYSNKIKKIENLGDLIELKELVLAKNMIEKMENLKSLKKCVLLNLQNNRITNFNEYQEIENFFQLKTLNLGYNYIRFVDKDILKFLPKIKYLNIVNNPLKKTLLQNRREIKDFKTLVPEFTFKID